MAALIVVFATGADSAWNPPAWVAITFCAVCLAVIAYRKFGGKQ